MSSGVEGTAESVPSGALPVRCGHVQGVCVGGETGLPAGMGCLLRVLPKTDRW